MRKQNNVHVLYCNLEIPNLQPIEYIYHLGRQNEKCRPHKRPSKSKKKKRRLKNCHSKKENLTKKCVDNHCSRF